MTEVQDFQSALKSFVMCFYTKTVHTLKILKNNGFFFNSVIQFCLSVETDG